MEDKIRSVRLKNLSTADEHCLKVINLGPESGLSVDPSTFGLIRNGLHGRVAVKKPFSRKGNREKRLSYAK